MVTATSTNTTGTTAAQFLCSTCDISFEHQNERREHMRTDWHVINVKRKVAGLPPDPARVYDNMIASTTTSFNNSKEEEIASENQTKASDVESSSEDEGIPSPQECLFCCKDFESVGNNLNHMLTSHGFSIPEIENLETDLETLLAYLALVISRFHSCIFCGREMRSAEAVRSHMLAKGHCMLDLSDESEFLEFWKKREGGNGDRVSEHELRLRSGGLVESKGASKTGIRRNRRTRQEDLSNRLSGYEQPAHDALSPGHSISASNQPNSNDLIQSLETGHPDPRTLTKASGSLSRRDQMGITGLSASQIQALAIAERKALSQEFRSRRQAEWTRDRLGNKTKQKYFKTCTICRSGLFLDPVRR